MNRVRMVVGIGILTMIAGCATLTNDAHQPVEFKVIGCETQEVSCTATNKRGRWDFYPPDTVMIRRSDDPLRINCNSNEGHFSHDVQSGAHTGKFAASIFLLDLGITDAITDKHREYPSSVIIGGCDR